MADSMLAQSAAGNLADSRVVFVGDWFRAILSQDTRPGTPRSNLAWLANLLAAPLSLSRQSLPIVLPSANPDQAMAQLGVPALGREFAANPQQAWAATYDMEPQPELFGDLFDAIPENALVVGFEIPPTIRRALAMRGHRYVTLHNHPLRFLNDLAFGVHSNDPAIVRSFEEIACSEEAIERQVARLSARFNRLDPAQARLPRGCPVLLGQTPFDASLIVNGHISTWKDKADQLAESLGDAQAIAYVKHPHASWPVSDLAFLRHDLGKTVIAVSGNSYPIIMSGQPHGPVITLSSSLGVEAAAFGYDCGFLVSDPRFHFAAAGLDNTMQVMADHRVFEREFWDKVVAGDGTGIPPRETPFYLGADFVRGTLESWAYGNLAGPHPFGHMEKLVLPSLTCKAEAVDELGALLVDADGASRSAIAEAALQLDIAVGLGVPALIAGSTWNWDRQLDLLGLPGTTGFSPVGADGVWAEGMTSRIELAVAPTLTGFVRLTGELNFSFFQGVLGARPALLLRVDDAPCAAFYHNGGDDPFHSMPWEAVVRSGQTVIFELECSHAAVPRDTGLGDDGRTLGMIVHALSATAQESDGDSLAAKFSVWGLGDSPVVLNLEKDWSDHE